jgi:transposase
MWYAGIDLHRRTAVIALVNDTSRRVRPRTFQCSEPDRIVEYLKRHRPFKAVIEASSFYRWLYDLLDPHGEVVLAHPLRLRAIWSGRAKTDKLDAKVLAELLRADLIPESYVPPERYQALRDLTRTRARLVRQRTRAANGIHRLLGRHNIEPRYKKVFGVRGLGWIEGMELPRASAFARDELVERVRHCDRAIARADVELSKLAEDFPETEALTDIHGIGLYSALLIAAEIARPERFRSADQVAAYAGLTPRVTQSGSTERRGSISKQGSAWLRWILVQAAIKVVRRDEALKRFYTRVRKRAGAKRARVAVARKLAEIVWKRLARWHRLRRAA